MSSSPRTRRFLLLQTCVAPPVACPPEAHLQVFELAIPGWFSFLKEHPRRFGPSVVCRWVGFFPCLFSLISQLITYHLASHTRPGKRSHSDCWNIPMFNRKYIDSIRVHFPASDLLVYQNVANFKHHYSVYSSRNPIPSRNFRPRKTDSVKTHEGKLRSFYTEETRPWEALKINTKCLIMLIWPF